VRVQNFIGGGNKKKRSEMKKVRGGGKKGTGAVNQKRGDEFGLINLGGGNE